MAAIESPSPQSTNLPFLALIAGGVAVGFSPIFVRLSDLAPLASGFHRLALSVPVLLLIAVLAPHRTDARAGPRDRFLLAATGVVFGSDIAFWHLALTYTTVADATLIANTAPIMVAIAAFTVFGERMKPLFFAGLALAVTGVGSLAVQKSGGAEPLNRLLGDAFGIGAAVSYAGYLLLVSHLRRRHGTQRIVLYSTVFSALTLLPLALWTSPSMLPASLAGWAVVVGLALIGQVGGQVSLTYALAHLPASFASLTQLMQAAVAALAAWMVLAESLTAMTLVSAAAILSGIYLCRRAQPA